MRRGEREGGKKMGLEGEREGRRGIAVEGRGKKGDGVE